MAQPRPEEPSVKVSTGTSDDHGAARALTERLRAAQARSQDAGDANRIAADRDAKRLADSREDQRVAEDRRQDRVADQRQRLTAEEQARQDTQQARALAAYRAERSDNR